MLMAIFDTMSEENIPAQIQWLYDCRSAETSLFHYVGVGWVATCCGTKTRLKFQTDKQKPPEHAAKTLISEIYLHPCTSLHRTYVRMTF